MVFTNVADKMRCRNHKRHFRSCVIVITLIAIFGVIIYIEVFFIDGTVLTRMLTTYESPSQQRFYKNYDCVIQSNKLNSIRVENVSVPRVAFAKDPVVTEKHKNLEQGNQLPHYPNGTMLLNDTWQSINGTRFKFYVFSAYLERRQTVPAIRVIAATKTNNSEEVWCLFWYRPTEDNSDLFTPKTVPANIKIIRENWNLEYSACFIFCPLKLNQTAPSAVSIVSNVHLPHTNMLTVHDNYIQTNMEKRFGICVKPLHNLYNKDLEMLEFIEFYRLLEVTHFTFYNHTTGPQVNCILEDYVSRNIVTLLPWQLNIVSQKQIRTEGIFAALNDCLYRSMYRFSHILLTDFDEFIIPRYNNTLPQLIEHMGTQTDTTATGAFSFQNGFFYLQFKDDKWVATCTDTLETSLVTLKKTRRKIQLNPHRQRSKYICRPELVVEVGNHFVWEFIPRYKTYNVPDNLAISQHYRVCEFGGDDCVNAPSKIDTTAWRYRNQLVAAVRNSYTSLSAKCKLNNLTLPPKTNFSSLS